jgi:hypothetical protein
MILGITRYNNKAGKSELIAVWKNAPMIYNTTTGGWNKAGIHLTAGKEASFETFIDCLFITNGTNPMYCYNGTTWEVGNVNPSVKGKYIKRYNTRLFLGNVTIAGVSYPSRVWYSDLPKADYSLRWGIESGTNLVQTAGSSVVTSEGAKFKDNNIKVGSQITITTGDNAGEYTVQKIDSETQLTLTEALTYSASNSSYWVGSNYFDVETDDGDEIKGFGVNSNELIILKNSSTHRYSSTGTLRKSRTTIGTSSPRSIVDLNDYTYFYHPSRGILRTDGSNIDTISNALGDIIKNVASENVDEVVGWVEDNRYVCFYIGDITTDDGESYTNLIAFFDTSNETWSTKTYGINITCATQSLESGIIYNYVGTDDDKVYKINTGTTQDGSSIHFGLETHPIFPAGSSSIVDFSRIRFYIEDGPDMQIMYKLVYRPSTIPNQWYTDKTWRALKGNAGSPKTEFIFPEGSRASGVVLKFIESSTQESFLIEKFEIYYKNVSNF